MKKFRKNLRNTGEEFWTFIGKHKSISIIIGIIIGIIIVVVIVGSIIAHHHRRWFWPLDWERRMIWWSFRDDQMMGGNFMWKWEKWGPMWKNGMSPEMRLFDRVCESGAIKDATWFMKNFKPGVEKKRSWKKYGKRSFRKGNSWFKE